MTEALDEIRLTCFGIKHFCLLNSPSNDSGSSDRKAVSRLSRDPGHKIAGGGVISCPDFVGIPGTNSRSEIKTQVSRPQLRGQN